MGAWLELSSEWEELSLPQPQGQHEEELYTPLSPESYRCLERDCKSFKSEYFLEKKLHIHTFSFNSASSLS